MMEVYTSVMKSNNYDMFKFMEGNRKISSTNLNQIISSMKEKQLVIPITVNEKFEIIDGQHRFSACKYLNLDQSHSSEIRMSCRHGWKSHGYHWKYVVKGGAHDKR